MKLQTLVGIVVAALIVVFVVSYLKEYFVKTEGFDEATPTCTYTAIAIPNAYIPNCSGTPSPFICNSYKTLSEAQTACNSVLGCKGITYRLDTAMGQHYSLRSGYVTDPTAPVASTVSSWNNESSYVITNLAVCKPNWQTGAPWQPSGTSSAGVAGVAGAGVAGAGVAGPAGGAGVAGPAGGAGAGAGAGVTGDLLNMGGTTGMRPGSVTIPGGTMVLTAATNTMWANSMASQPAPLQGGASVTAAGAGAGAGTTAGATAGTTAGATGGV